MPVAGSPVLDHRSSLASLSSADRELARNNLTNYRSRPTASDQQPSSVQLNLQADYHYRTQGKQTAVTADDDYRYKSHGKQTALTADDDYRYRTHGKQTALTTDDDYRYKAHGKQTALTADDDYRYKAHGKQTSLTANEDDRYRTHSKPPVVGGRDQDTDLEPKRSARVQSPSDGSVSQRQQLQQLQQHRQHLLEQQQQQEQLQQPHHQHQKNKKKKKKNPITANLGGTRYEVVRQIVELLGFTLSREDDPSSYLIWNDSFVSSDRISELKPYQRINHFPGMGEICRKDCLARNMAKMARAHPEDFNFVPKTWILPSEFSIFQNYVREMKQKKKSKTFIVKPANGAMGNGISLVRNAEKIPPNENLVVQEYIDKPLLIDGYKCDMRIYVLMTSCDPLRLFLFNDGLLRMGTEKYTHPTDTNIEHLFMHLTNYSVNKHNEYFEKTGAVDTGSKRSLKFFNEYLRKHDYDVAFLWRNITDMIIKTMIVAHPHVLHAYRMCRPGQPPGSDSVSFELLGFDVMLDRKLRPWLLEINRSPSFGTDEKLDYDIKSGVVEDTLRLLNIKASDKRKNIAAQKAQAQRRLLRPTKRLDGDVTEMEKKRQVVERRKEELKDLLTRLRKDTAREDFENRNSGRFKRVFPPEDKFRREKYAAMLSEAYSVFLSGRGNNLQQEIQRVYSNTLREEDIIDMLAQCEADEQEGRNVSTNRAPRGPKPLQSMPVLERGRRNSEEEEDDEEEDGEYSPPGSSLSRGTSLAQRNSWGHQSRPTSERSTADSRPGSIMQTQRSRSLSRPISSKPSPVNGQMTEETLIAISQKEREEELTKRTLAALNDMHIKFPGKTDEEADFILDKLHENWKFHKPRIASYWLVKLDSIKRRKVIDIVRSNVRAVLQRIWKCVDVDSLHIYRIFSRVFNRLLWSHGQGLWNCFQTTGGNSWETIFNKSSETVNASELACCRRIVQLCRDCLLIVYQFASEAKNTGQAGHLTSSGQDTSASATQLTRAPSLTCIDKAGTYSPGAPLSQRLSRLYQNRPHSLHNLHGPS